MKTSTTSGLPYSVYPLQIIEIEKEKTEPQIIKMVQPYTPSAAVDKKNLDEPSNWDESWFSNYE